MDAKVLEKLELNKILAAAAGGAVLEGKLSSVQTLAKACGYNLVKFTQMLDTALPKKFQQMPLLFPDEFE